MIAFTLSAVIIAVLCNIASISGDSLFVFPAANSRLLSPDDGCGKFVQPTRVKTAIISHSEKGFMPFVAQLGYNSTSGLEWICGGSLITAQHVLTTASCVDNSLSIVRLGQIDRGASDDGHIDRTVVSSKKHPKYNPPELWHNIAVLQLDRSVPFSPAVWPICLPWAEPQRSRDFTDYNPFVVGWWSTLQLGSGTGRLLDRQHTVQQSCHRVPDSGVFVQTPGMICTDNFSQDHGPCIDEGSPLVQPQRVDERIGYRMFQTGVGLFGMDCEFDDELRSPVGYTRVQDYVDWIAESL